MCPTCWSSSTTNTSTTPGRYFKINNNYYAINRIIINNNMDNINYYVKDFISKKGFDCPIPFSVCLSIFLSIYQSISLSSIDPSI